MNSDNPVVKLFEVIRLNPKISYRTVLSAAYFMDQWHEGILSDESITAMLKEILEDEK